MNNQFDITKIKWHQSKFKPLMNICEAAIMGKNVEKAVREEFSSTMFPAAIIEIARELKKWDNKQLQALNDDLQNYKTNIKEVKMVKCARCGKPVSGEARMLKGEPIHMVCPIADGAEGKDQKNQEDNNMATKDATKKGADKKTNDKPAPAKKGDTPAKKTAAQTKKEAKGDNIYTPGSKCDVILKMLQKGTHTFETLQKAITEKYDEKTGAKNNVKTYISMIGKKVQVTTDEKSGKIKAGTEPLAPAKK